MALLNMNGQIFEEASEWLIDFRMDEATHAERLEFQRWLDTSPEHVRAYLQLVSVWEDSALLDSSRKLDLEELIVLSKREGNVIDLNGTGIRTHRFRATSWSRPAIAASILMLCAAALGAWYWNAFQRGSYTTEVGQQRTLALSDGTAVELNADTRIRERYTDSRRTVELERGQALFRVARDPTRPFVVMSDHTAVQAVGTQFDVRRSRAGITVTVLEGSVAVLPSVSPKTEGEKEARAAAALLMAGEQTTVTSSASPAPKKRANTAIATAWTRQKLVFESATLAEAAEEFNRFNTRKLIVAPEGFEDFLINGTFPALDPASLTRFLRFLREQPGIVLVEEGDTIRVEKNR